MHTMVTLYLRLCIPVHVPIILRVPELPLHGLKSDVSFRAHKLQVCTHLSLILPGNRDQQELPSLPLPVVPVLLHCTVCR